jgi:SAM-dependent methyltransferase
VNDSRENDAAVDPLVDAAGWDARYARSELVWGAPPNDLVVEHVTALSPGRALDVACGEGRNSLWLATHGWQVDAVDFSQTGIDKARTVASRLSRSVRERVRWHCADVTALDDDTAPGPYDLGLMIFLHLRADARRAVLTDVAARLAPGGTLIVVGHDSTNLTEGYGGPSDPSILFTPDDVVADLAAALEIRHAERRLRATEGRDAIDALVVATRP